MIVRPVANYGLPEFLVSVGLADENVRFSRRGPSARHACRGRRLRLSPSGRLVVVGTGLIGGSIALELAIRFAGAIVGVDASQARLDEGREAGVFDETGLPQDLCAEDLVVATPTLTVPVLNDLAGLGSICGQRYGD